VAASSLLAIILCHSVFLDFSFHQPPQRDYSVYQVRNQLPNIDPNSDEPHNQLPRELASIGLLEAAITNCKCGVTIADMRQPDMPLVYINQAFSKITGYSMEEAIGKNCRFLQGPSRNPEARALIRDALQNGKQLKVQLENFRKDGTLFWNELHMAPVFMHGELTHYVGIQNDITEEVLAKQALKEALESKDMLLGVAAHDLRNPLALVKSLVGLARDSDLRGMEAILGMMDQITDKALNMVRDILDLSAIRSGRVMIQKRETDLGSFLERYRKSAVPMAQMKGMSFEIEKDLAEPKVNLDTDRIEQVLDNLLSNAIKFSKRGSMIRLRVASVVGKVVFEMIDEGQGIPSAELALIFKPFTRSSTRPTEDEASSGLGLAITQRLVELHDGSIEVQSEPGKGSCFRMELRG